MVETFTYDAQNGASAACVLAGVGKVLRNVLDTYKQ